MTKNNPYISGKNKVTRKEVEFYVNTVLNLIKEISDKIKVLKENNIIHGDLNLDNIIIKNNKPYFNRF